jgi:hypothetical protein
MKLKKVKRERQIKKEKKKIWREFERLRKK